MNSINSTLVPDLALARRFIELLTGDTDGVVTFQTFDDSALKRGGLARVLHGNLGQHESQLVKLNQQGAGVFVMVNEGDGKVREGKTTCRTIANVVKVRALFVDLDGSPLQPVLDAGESPHIVIESSPGRWHGYWRTTDTTLAEFGACQTALAQLFSADPSVKDLPRVMRMPGFFHQKSSTPFMTRIVSPPP
jgi:hypothetical protein